MSEPGEEREFVESVTICFEKMSEVIALTAKSIVSLRAWCLLNSVAVIVALVAILAGCSARSTPCAEDASRLECQIRVG